MSAMLELKYSQNMDGPFNSMECSNCKNDTVIRKICFSNSLNGCEKITYIIQALQFEYQITKLRVVV